MAAGLGTETVNVHVSEDAKANGAIASVNTITIPEGSTGNFQVRLALAPAAPVSVAAANSSGDADVTVAAGQSLTFTAGGFDTQQAVTLAAAEDDDALDDSAVITLSGPGLRPRTLHVIVKDNDGMVDAGVVTPPPSDAGLGSQPVGDSGKGCDCAAASTDKRSAGVTALLALVGFAWMRRRSRRRRW
jgi:MYXO-CTERM domain-containing protein